MLSRSEIQYDLLQCLFDDDNDVFTNHAPFYENAERQPVYQRLTFRSLYCQALLRSEKLTGTVRKVITENEDFALEYAKVALLVNVGRLDTTTGCTCVPKWRHLD
jgi:Ino eighty subunit 1